jgi:hypothetical protein
MALSSRRTLLTAPIVVTLAWFATVAASGQQPMKQAVDPVLRPIADSPLAASESAVFAVGMDRRTLIWRPIAAGPGERMPVKTPLRDIRGLSWGQGALFALDGATRTIYRIRVEDGTVTPIARDGPYLKPSDMAYAGHLFVADPGKVFEIDPDAGTIERLPEFPGTLGSRLALAGSGTDLLYQTRTRERSGTSSE